MQHPTAVIAIPTNDNLIPTTASGVIAATVAFISLLANTLI